MDPIKIKYSAYAKAIPPRPIRVSTSGWGGLNQKMIDGSEPQPWHCLPFVEGSTYGLELVYQYETPCQVINEGGAVRFEWDFASEPGGLLTGGEFITFEPQNACKFYLFNTRLDLVPPAGYVVRTEPHPRFFTDETHTVPLAMIGHLQNEWYPRKLFVVFRSPRPGERHIFRKGEAFAQLLFLPHHVSYDMTPMSAEEEAARRKMETEIDNVRGSIASNRWQNPAGSHFNNHYKILASAFTRAGVDGVAQCVHTAVEKHHAALPTDQPIAQCLTLGHAHLDAGRYDDAKAVYTHVLSREPQNAEALSHLGICVACRGAPANGLKLMTDAVALQPRSPMTHNNLGELLRLMGRYADAEAAFRNSLQLQPRDAGILSTLGQTVAAQGRLEEGLKMCQAAADMPTKSPAVHMRLGDILKKLGRPAEARTAYEAAVAISPEFAPAKAALANLR